GFRNPRVVARTPPVRGGRALGGVGGAHGTPARGAGLRPVLWSAWGRDWTADASPVSVRAEVARGLRGGATVLLHDSDALCAPGSWRAALGALPGLVADCRARGLVVGRLADHGVGRPGGRHAEACGR
ncbi:polysaccharide deacetylase family protein, partial [Streptomyces sp. Act-28]